MKVGQDDPGYDTYLAIKNAKDARVREKIEEDFDFEGAKIYSIDAASKTDIKRPYFRDATILEGAEFDGATISGQARFSNAIIAGRASFNNAVILGDASFDNAKLWVANFEGTQIGSEEIDGSAWFGGATMWGCQFIGATIWGAVDFSNAIL